MILIQVSILLIAVVVFKPYEKVYFVKNDTIEIQIKENTLSNDIKIFDSRTLKWIDKEQYIVNEIERIEAKYEDLKIDDVQLMIDIYDSKHPVYDFIPLGIKADLHTDYKIDMLKAGKSFFEIAKVGRKHVDIFNELIDSYKQKAAKTSKELLEGI